MNFKTIFILFFYFFYFFFWKTFLFLRNYEKAITDSGREWLYLFNRFNSFELPYQMAGRGGA